MVPRFNFKSNVKYDITLLTEIESINPYAAKIEKSAWLEIAQKLQDSDLKMKVTERSCKERATALLKSFIADETLSCKLSGVEEGELDAVKLLLTNVAKLYSDKTKSLSPLYDKKNRTQGEKIRTEVLNTLTVEEDDVVDMPTNVNIEITDQALPQVQSPEAAKVEPPKKKFRKGDIVSYLENKHGDEMQFKRDELKLRVMEAENRKMELELERDRLAQATALKNEELALKKDKQKSEAEEKTMLTQALIKVLSKQ